MGDWVSSERMRERALEAAIAEGVALFAELYVKERTIFRQRGDLFGTHDDKAVVALAFDPSGDPPSALRLRFVEWLECAGVIAHEVAWRKKEAPRVLSKGIARSIRANAALLHVLERLASQ